VNDSPNVVLAIFVLLLVGVQAFAIFRFLRMADDIQKIREHLDRAVPDFVRANKARVREKVAGIQSESAGDKTEAER
jgi:hypothetical protein